MELIPFAEKDLDAFLAMCRDMYKSPAVAHSVGAEVFTATFRACLAGNQNVEGRMIVEIGLAVVRPAEFVILRFAQTMAEG